MFLAFVITARHTIVKSCDICQFSSCLAASESEDEIVNNDSEVVANIAS